MTRDTVKLSIGPLIKHLPSVNYNPDFPKPSRRQYDACSPTLKNIPRRAENSTSKVPIQSAAKHATCPNKASACRRAKSALICHFARILAERGDRYRPAKIIIVRTCIWKFPKHSQVQCGFLSGYQNLFQIHVSYCDTNWESHCYINYRMYPEI